MWTRLNAVSATNTQTATLIAVWLNRGGRRPASETNSQTIEIATRTSRSSPALNGSLSGSVVESNGIM